MVDYVEMSLLQYYMSSIFNCVNLIWSRTEFNEV